MRQFILSSLEDFPSARTASRRVGTTGISRSNRILFTALHQVQAQSAKDYFPANELLQTQMDAQDDAEP
jgi:hypothetical protein